MHEIVLLKQREAAFKIIVRNICGYGSLYQSSYTISHETAYLVQRTFPPTHLS